MTNNPNLDIVMLITRVLPISLSSSLRKNLFLGLSLLSFLVPFTLGSSQIITGTLVNATLFASAILLPSKLFLPVIFLPSLAVLSRGLIFGPLTHLLFFMVPFIWLGNLSLVLVFKKIYPRSGYFFAVFSAAIIKTFVLFFFSHLLFNFHLVPSLFLKTMGLNQLLTALFGALTTFLVLPKIVHGKL